MRAPYRESLAQGQEPEQKAHAGLTSGDRLTSARFALQDGRQPEGLSVSLESYTVPMARGHLLLRLGHFKDFPSPGHYSLYFFFLLFIFIFFF